MLTPRRDGPASAEFLVLPYAGIGASLAVTLARFITAPVAVHGLQLPGRENRLSDPPLPSIEAVVAAMLVELAPLFKRPYVLMGCSLGALIAYELAQRLQARGAPPAMFIVLACASPTLGRFRTGLSRLGDAELLDALDRRFGGVPEIVKQSVDLQRLFVPALRADAAMLDAYEWTSRPPLESALLTIGGADDRAVRPEDLADWAGLVRGPAEHCIIGGGHFVLRENPGAVAAVLNSRLLRQMG